MPGDGKIKNLGKCQITEETPQIVKDVLEAVSDSSFRCVGIYVDEAGHSGGIGYPRRRIGSVEGDACWYSELM